MNRRFQAWIAWQAALIPMALFTLTATAQTYPTKPVRIVVPYAAGGLPESATARELFRSIDLPDWAASRRAVLRAESPEPVRSRLVKTTLDFIDELERRLLP